MSKWAWWYESSGPYDYRIRELLRAIWDLHAMYSDDAPWLWRGQANADYNIEPGIHTRILSKRPPLDNDSVVAVTTELIKAARTSLIDRHEGILLPDMALLAALQHHGAATPLLDVSLDPMVALYMAVVSPIASDADKDGVLFAIKRPPVTIEPYDSRNFELVYRTLPSDIVVLYSAPDVSERLRIQRGHFLISSVSNSDTRSTIPLKLDARAPLADAWIWKRMSARGGRGRPPSATSDVAVYRIAADFKLTIQTWLEERSGLTKDFVYPTAWHQPHLERFATSHGRRANF